MNTLTPIQQLDCVLNFLSKNYQYQYKIDSVVKELNIGLDQPEIHQILAKLEKDGYAIMREIKFENPIDVGNGFFKSSEWTYIVTFDGKLFQSSGGYSQQAVDNNLHLEAERIDGSIRRANEKRLVKWTFWLAVLTGALVLTEILIHWEELKHFFSRP